MKSVCNEPSFFFFFLNHNPVCAAILCGKWVFFLNAILKLTVIVTILQVFSFLF